jgi:N,N'-diacetyllegionaminate synthase
LGQIIKHLLNLRNIEKALGTGIKEPTPSESLNIPVMRKSIVAKTEIKKGEVFTENNLCVKRPGIGINSMKWDEIIGLPASFDFQPDDIIKL